jgi:hypothetical protein
LILKVKETYPSKTLKYEYIPRATDETLNVAVNKLEETVAKWYCKGYRYINLPNQTLLTQNWALGTAGDLGGVGASIRWPEATFVVENSGFPLLGSAGTDNIFRLTDVPTTNDPSLLVFNINSRIQGAGQVFFVFESNDPTAVDIKDNYKAALTAAIPGLVFNELPVTFDGTNFDQAALNAAAAFIDATAPAGDVSVIAHDPNGLHITEYRNQALAAGLFSDFGGRATAFGANFAPSVDSGTVPVDIPTGLNPVTAVPSDYLASLGLPLEMQAFQTVILVSYLVDYLEAYVWMATCGKTEGILDKNLKFDSNRSRIAYWLAEQVVPADTLTAITTGFVQNGRWVNQNSPATPVV